ncbi:MAG TPA: hypothetical protein VMN60_10020 [Longimicrobiales bacterium]|nr:hypothetical protein [Longimicrobiales bacterium]
MNIVIACAVGLIAGAHTATWGMYKDAVHEGFELRKYLRSILLSGTIAPVCVLLGFPLTDAGSLVVLFGITYVIERAVSEFYKTFLRDEDQSKYFIPMQFAVRGRVVKSRRTRLLVGAGAAAAGAVLMLLVVAFQNAVGPEPGVIVVLIAGSLGGWFSAVGGAWKDAPIEGFETLKFFRSPVLSAFAALLVSAFTQNIAFMALAGLGFTIATLETYKTFCFPSKPRGKFAGKSIAHPEMLERRRWFVPLYWGIWLLIATGFVTGAVGASTWPG